MQGYDKFPEGAPHEGKAPVAPKPSVQEVAKANKMTLILRFVDWLSAVVIFGAISDKGIDSNGNCWFGYKDDKTGSPSYSAGACDFGIFMGVMTWLLEFVLIFVLLLPALNPRWANFPPWLRAFSFYGSVFWTILWLANALNLAIQYTVTCTTMADNGGLCSDKSGQQAELGAVFFSWVCLCCWCVTCGLAAKAYMAPGAPDMAHRPEALPEGGHGIQAPAAAASEPLAPAGLPSDHSLHEPLDVHHEGALPVHTDNA